MTELRFIITAKDCLFNYDMEFGYNEIAASPQLIEQKIQEVLDGSVDTLQKFGTVDFDFFAFCPDLVQAVIAFTINVTSTVEYSKYKLKYPEDYQALIELISFYHTLETIVARPNHTWIILDRDMKVIDPFKQIH